MLFWGMLRIAELMVSFSHWAAYEKKVPFYSIYSLKVSHPSPAECTDALSTAVNFRLKRPTSRLATFNFTAGNV